MSHHLSRRSALKLSAACALSPSLFIPSRAAAQDRARPDPYADAKFIAGQPPAIRKGSFTIAILPDTQNYSQSYPEQFLAQTSWIAANRQARNIACVLHLGDITNRNTPEQWQNAQKAMHQLDGHVPYFMTLGNHDYSEGGRCADRTTLFNEYFPLTKYRQSPHFGGVYDKEPDRLENNYHTFEAGDRRFIVISLEFGPRADVVRWANDVAARHADREAILITHAYMYFDETRYDWQKYGPKQSWNPHKYGVAAATNDDVHDGEQLWQNLISKHDNFILTLNGHVLNDGLARLTSKTPANREVHQVLVNFQMKPQGGDGWLRLMEFEPDGQTVQIHDYSPTRDQRNESDQNRFTLKLAKV